MTLKYCHSVTSVNRFDTESVQKVHLGLYCFTVGILQCFSLFIYGWKRNLLTSLGSSLGSTALLFLASKWWLLPPLWFFYSSNDCSSFCTSPVSMERWCRLRGNLLFYFKSRDELSDPAGVIVVEDCTVHQDEDEDSCGIILAFSGGGGTCAYAQN